MKHDVDNPRRLAQVDEDEKNAHRNRRDRQKFAKDGDAAKLLVIVQIVGQNYHDRGSGDTHKEGELRNVEAPTYIAAESGDGQPVRQL